MNRRDWFIAGVVGFIGALVSKVFGHSPETQASRTPLLLKSANGEIVTIRKPGFLRLDTTEVMAGGLIVCDVVDSNGKPIDMMVIGNMATMKCDPRSFPVIIPDALIVQSVNQEAGPDGDSYHFSITAKSKERIDREDQLIFAATTELQKRKALRERYGENWELHHPSLESGSRILADCLDCIQ